MSVNNYRKFKVSISEESRKVQGLQTGDIVRRQYFDGTNIIYSLMLVLSSGTEEILNEAEEIVTRNYFIGALLEGDAPTSDQVLDFVRVTNLFNEDRLGALYLTASDDQAPYMDIIDGIGKNKSLMWPTDIGSGKYETLNGNSNLVYSTSEGERRRIVTINSENEGPCGFRSNFTQYVANPNRVIVSYWVKGSASLTASLEYSNGIRTDGSETYQAGEDWTYKVHVFTVDYSGRHLRTFKLTNESGVEIQVSDLNIILLSSVSNFAEASQIRWGKLDGIVDPVYGRLHGYGGYAQKLFVAGSAHVTGTLTAGDENGFGATFYAGKIHRNNFVNSLEPSFSTTTQAISNEVVNPTGIGNVYRMTEEFAVNAQVRNWARGNRQKMYTLSFWVYAKAPCEIEVFQDGLEENIGKVRLEDKDLYAWQRCSISYFVALNSQLSNITPYRLLFSPTFGESTDTIISGVTTENVIYFSAPQIESGGEATQYQATDEELDETEDYGAWFSRGGIGGTIQNPLLRLNFDGEGSIGTKTQSFLLRADGSGYFAKANISWDENGNITFGENVMMGWNNLAEGAKDQLRAKTINIIGDDTQVVIHGAMAGQDSFSPTEINLRVECYGFTASQATFQWQYLLDGAWTNISKATQQTLVVDPRSPMWSKDNTINIRCVATIGDITCYAAHNLKKIFVDGYSVEITSDQGTSFRNGDCQTTLTANIYFRGERITDPEALKGFAFTWRKYRLPDIENEIENWWMAETDEDGEIIRPAIDRVAQSITLNYSLDGQDYYTCTVATTNMFTYTFPITF